MGLYFGINSGSASVASLSKIRRCGRLFLLVCLVLVFSVHTARSYDYENDINVSRETSTPFDEIITLTKNMETVDRIKPWTRSSDYKSSSTTGNLCTSLLNTQNTHSSKTPVVRTQRPVGKVAVLGLLVGARFAIAPPEQHNRAIVDEPETLLECQVVSLDGKDAPVRSARTIAKYRQCQKDLALGRIASAR